MAGLSEPAEVSEPARVAAEAIHELCRATLSRPALTPADVDVVLGRLAEAVAALPQAARQLGDILEQATRHHVLAMDTLTETQDPESAVRTARFHLDALAEPAEDLRRRLDAAHNETAHISAVTSRPDTMRRRRFVTPPVSRPEDRQPPTGGGTGPGIPR